MERSGTSGCLSLVPRARSACRTPEPINASAVAAVDWATAGSGAGARSTDSATAAGPSGSSAISAFWATDSLLNRRLNQALEEGRMPRMPTGRNSSNRIMMSEYATPLYFWRPVK